jgi:hypothetical protein
VTGRLGFSSITNNDKISNLPRKRRLLPPVVRPSFGWACLGFAAIPRNLNRQIAGLAHQRVESTQRTTANDYLDWFLCCHADCCIGSFPLRVQLSPDSKLSHGGEFPSRQISPRAYENVVSLMPVFRCCPLQ